MSTVQILRTKVNMSYVFDNESVEATATVECTETWDDNRADLPVGGETEKTVLDDKEGHRSMSQPLIFMMSLDVSRSS